MGEEGAEKEKAKERGKRSARKNDVTRGQSGIDRKTQRETARG